MMAALFWAILGKLVICKYRNRSKIFHNIGMQLAVTNVLWFFLDNKMKALMKFGRKHVQLPGTQSWTIC